MMPGDLPIEGELASHVADLVRVIEKLGFDHVSVTRFIGGFEIKVYNGNALAVQKFLNSMTSGQSCMFSEFFHDYIGIGIVSRYEADDAEEEDIIRIIDYKRCLLM